MSAPDVRLVEVIPSVRFASPGAERYLRPVMAFTDDVPGLVASLGDGPPDAGLPPVGD